MLQLLRFWVQLDTPVDRRTYLTQGLALAAIKYAGDASLVAAGTGQLWTPQDYLTSVYSLLTRFPVDGPPRWLLPVLAVWTLPFLWLGVTLTLRRVIDAGLPTCWIAFLFFVPYLNYVLMAGLAVMPSARNASMHAGTRGRVTSATTGTIVSITAGIALGIAGVLTMLAFPNAYTGALFLGLPFAMGALTAFLFNRSYREQIRDTMAVTTAMVLGTGGILFLLATEGLVCLLMALPLGFATAVGGAILGRAIAGMGDRRIPPAFFAVLSLPLLLAAPPSIAGRIVHEVQTSIEIAAPPDRVWRHVVAFPPIPQPRNLLFRLGIAYPEYAVIHGEGVRAVRYCVFSTGAFVEPITAWEPGRRLSFDVVKSPAPLRELTLSEGVSPPHLDGYLRPVRGEFRLVALAGGRTRLEGSTWYQLEMGPEGYWQVFSDYAIGRIHERVLQHIRAEAESDPS